MAQAGGTLQNYNSELVGCIEELREKREELNKSIAADEEEKAKIQNDLRILTERLARINDNLARKISSRNEYDKTIQETEAAYAKVRARATPGAAPRLPPLRCRRSRLSHLAPPGPTWPRPPRRLWRVLKRCCTC